jgi:hypothetical protein
MVVNYTGPTPFAAVRSAIIAGFNATSAAHWDAKGISSSSASGSNSAQFGVGYAEASEVLGISGTQTASWTGETVDADSVLARYTLLGDATLNGAVDFNDLVQLAQNYNVVDGTRTWFTGDFTYDGNTDFNDLVKLAQNYNTALPAGPIPGARADFGADLAAAFASVPEPGCISVLAMAACGLAGRRRRRRVVR